MSRIIISDIRSINQNGKSFGHYFPVAKNYTEILGNDCYVAGGPIYRQEFGDKHIELPYDSKPTVRKWKGKWHELINCRTLFRKAEGDIIIMQSVAQLTAYVGTLLYYRRKSKLYFIQYCTESIDSWWKRGLFKLISKRVDGIICSSDKVGKAFGLPYIVVTDYIYAGSQKAANVIPFSEKKYDFLCLGTIWPDKGFVEVARRFANTPYTLLVAGKPCNEEIGKELVSICKDAKNIELRLGHVDDEDYHRYMSDSRYAILNYRGSYAERSSGVVLDIIFARLPLLVPDNNAMQFVKENGLGYVYKNIESFDPAPIMKESAYNNYLADIDTYFSRQNKYKDDILRFVKKDSIK